MTPKEHAKNIISQNLFETEHPDWAYRVRKRSVAHVDELINKAKDNAEYTFLIQTKIEIQKFKFQYD